MFYVQCMEWRGKGDIRCARIDGVILEKRQKSCVITKPRKKKEKSIISSLPLRSTCSKMIVKRHMVHVSRISSFNYLHVSSEYHQCRILIRFPVVNQYPFFLVLFLVLQVHSLPSCKGFLDTHLYSNTFSVHIVICKRSWYLHRHQVSHRGRLLVLVYRGKTLLWYQVFCYFYMSTHI